jgi:hypothetical protein
MSLIVRKRWRHGASSCEVEELMAEIDEIQAPKAAGEPAHAEAVRRRLVEVHRLARALQKQARSVLVTAGDLCPTRLVEGVGAAGCCPDWEALGNGLGNCLELYDELQVALGLPEGIPPRFGTRG